MRQSHRSPGHIISGNQVLLLLTPAAGRQGPVQAGLLGSVQSDSSLNLSAGETAPGGRAVPPAWLRRQPEPPIEVAQTGSQMLTALTQKVPLLQWPVAPGALPSCRGGEAGWVWDGRPVA